MKSLSTRRSTRLACCISLMGPAVWQASAAAADTNSAAGDRPASLPTVTVQAPPLRLPEAPPESFSGAGLAAGVPGVSLRSQGFLAPQADLQVRGGAFNAGGFLLSGLALRNPQTEHFQSDLPLPSFLFTEPELLTGLDRFRTSSGHPAGSLALDFAPVTPRGYAEAGGGADGHAFLRLFDARSREPGAGWRGGTLFGAMDQVDRTDGHPDNDLERRQAGGHVQYDAGPMRVDLLAAGSDRRFGARGFYGAPASYPAEEEVADGLLFGAVDGALGPAIAGRTALAWRYTDDTYWLDRDRRELYVNKTKTHTLGWHGALSHEGPAGWLADVRVDADLEEIDGTHEGSMGGTGLGRHGRRHLSVAALPGRVVGPLTFTAGGSCDLFSGDRPAWLPALGVDWRVNAVQRVFASYTESVRQPSFTELNYESPGSLGNSGLERQHTRTVETGWRLVAAPLRVRATVFAEEGRELVDWVRTESSERWTAVNLDKVRTCGLAADAAWALTRRVDLTFSYLGLDKESDTAVYAGRYALDYARHDARAGLRLRPGRGLRVHGWQGAARYAFNPVREGPDTGLAAGADASWATRGERVELTLSVFNLWDDDFQVYAGQPPPGRRVYAAVRLGW